MDSRTVPRRSRFDGALGLVYLDRTTPDQAVEQTGLLQEFDEERQLTKRGDRRVRLPRHIDTPGVGVDRNRPISRRNNRRLFTQRVPRNQSMIFVHASMVLAILSGAQHQPPDLG